MGKLEKKKILQRLRLHVLPWKFRVNVTEGTVPSDWLILQLHVLANLDCFPL